MRTRASEATTAFRVPRPTDLPANANRRRGTDRDRGRADRDKGLAPRPAKDIDAARCLNVLEAASRRA
jgi:hypothetical protein